MTLCSLSLYDIHRLHIFVFWHTCTHVFLHVRLYALAYLCTFASVWERKRVRKWGRIWKGELSLIRKIINAYAYIAFAFICLYVCVRQKKKTQIVMPKCHSLPLSLTPIHAYHKKRCMHVYLCIYDNTPLYTSASSFSLTIFLSCPFHIHTYAFFTFSSPSL